MSRGASPAMFLPSNRISPESGASWPLIMLKQVDLPAPFGPIMARNSPCSTAKPTSLTARTPPKALDSERTVEHAHDAPLPLRQSDAKRADDALRERQHQQQDDDAEQRAPIFGLPHHGVLQRGEHRGADDRAGQRLDAAEQHHHQAVDRAADMPMVSGEIEPLAKANSPPATPQTPPAMAKPSQCTRLTSMPMASARSAESRPARMA